MLAHFWWKLIKFSGECLTWTFLRSFFGWYFDHVFFDSIPMPFVYFFVIWLETLGQLFQMLSRPVRGLLVFVLQLTYHILWKVHHPFLLINFTRCLPTLLDLLIHIHQGIQQVKLFDLDLSKQFHEFDAHVLLRSLVEIRSSRHSHNWWRHLHWNKGQKWTLLWHHHDLWLLL